MFFSFSKKKCLEIETLLLYTKFWKNLECFMQTFCILFKIFFAIRKLFCWTLSQLIFWHLFWFIFFHQYNIFIIYFVFPFSYILCIYFVCRLGLYTQKEMITTNRVCQQPAAEEVLDQRVKLISSIKSALFILSSAIIIFVAFSNTLTW